MLRDLKSLQKDNFTIYFIADLHALTTQAMGLDPTGSRQIREQIKALDEIIRLLEGGYGFAAAGILLRVKSARERYCGDYEKAASSLRVSNEHFRASGPCPEEKLRYFSKRLKPLVANLGGLANLQYGSQESNKAALLDWTLAKRMRLEDQLLSGKRLRGKDRKLEENVCMTAAAFLAAGVEPDALFVQSHVAAHSQLAWILSCYTPTGGLELMTQFKDKASNRLTAPAGLLTYPILMAADILLYDADVVPVGDDQKQHLNFTRDLAQRFNHCTGTDTFKLPEPVITKANHARVMSLDDGTVKMSKSNPSAKSYISLLDSEAEIRKKIKSAKTDTLPVPGTEQSLEARPEARNLLSIYAALKNTSLEGVLKKYDGKGWGEFKPELADAVVETVVPIGDKMRQLLKGDRNEIKSVLEKGAKVAKGMADTKINEVMEVIGAKGVQS